ncbi:MAG TPA: SIR2 family protein [Acidobacteriota bacterium]|nr:SIR2 family protein [Acidobacteriota bacterium]
MDEIYILGAGASFEHGAPLTKDILPYALKLDEGDERLQIVRCFLKDIFHFDAEQAADDEDSFPSLVDALSVVDLALDRHENLAKNYDQKKLREVRQALEYAVFRSLEHSLSSQTSNQRPRSKATLDLIHKLNADSKAAIISLNYDVIVDIALFRRTDQYFEFESASTERLEDVEASTQRIDYGVEFANFEKVEATVAEPGQGFPLYKLHGSFNWLLSKVTGNLYYGGLQKAVGVLYGGDIESLYREGAQLFGEQVSALEPILVTPTHLKDLRNPHLAGIWRKAEMALRQAKRVIFIGYSLPGDDMHIKYLLKRSLETNPHRRRAEIVVVNPSKWDQSNFRKFFGDQVVSHQMGFADYVNNVM